MMTAHSENVKIIGGENCGNSPKMLLLRDFNVAYVKNDIEFCMDWITEDIVWEIIGDKEFKGQEEYEEALSQMTNDKQRELHFENIMTPGKVGAVNGTIILEDKQSFAFCDVYDFKGHSKNSKIEKITSYVIKID